MPSAPQATLRRKKLSEVQLSRPAPKPGKRSWERGWEGYKGKFCEIICIVQFEEKILITRYRIHWKVSWSTPSLITPPNLFTQGLKDGGEERSSQGPGNQVASLCPRTNGHGGDYIVDGRWNSVFIIMHTQYDISSKPRPTDIRTSALKPR